MEDQDLRDEPDIEWIDQQCANDGLVSQFIMIFGDLPSMHDANYMFSYSEFSQTQMSFPEVPCCNGTVEMYQESFFIADLPKIFFQEPIKNPRHIMKRILRNWYSKINILEAKNFFIDWRKKFQKGTVAHLAPIEEEEFEDEDFSGK